MIHDQPELGIERHRDLAVSRGDPEHRGDAGAAVAVSPMYIPWALATHLQSP